MSASGDDRRHAVPTTGRRAALAFGAWACASAGVSRLLGGCISPTLPLPPPLTPSMAMGPTAATVRLSSVGGAQANAILVVYNMNPAVPLSDRVGGAQADGQGSWTAIVVATTGDTLEVSQQVGTETSPSITLVVPVFAPVSAKGADGGT